MSGTVKVKRVPECGWAVFDDGRKVLPAGERAWFATRRHAVAALAGIADPAGEPATDKEGE